MGIYIINQGSTPETHQPVSLTDDKTGLLFIGHLPITATSEANINGFLTTKPFLVSRYWNIAQESVIPEPLIVQLSRVAVPGLPSSLQKVCQNWTTETKKNPKKLKQLQPKPFRNGNLE